MASAKLKAFRLRKKLKTYSEISEELGVSKASLSSWFRDEAWSSKIARENHKKNYTPEKISAMQMARREFRADQSLGAKKEAESQFRSYKKQILFTAGLMLYLSGGDRSLKNNFVRLSSSEPYTLAIFKHFLAQYAAEYTQRIRISLLLYPDLDEGRCREWWSALTEIEAGHFTKSQVIKGRLATKKLLYGVATLTISSKALKIKLLRWIDLSSRELTNAGIV